MPYDGPGRRVEVVFPGMGTNHEEAIPTNTFAFVDNKVLLLTKVEQLGPFVDPTTALVSHIQPGELCVGFQGGIHEVALVGALANAAKGDRLWIDTATQAIITSGGGGTGGSPANEKQSVKVQGTAGNFKLAWVNPANEAGETGNIKFNATPAEVQLALEAMPNIEPGDVTVTGGPGNEAGSAPYVVLFGGRYADTDVAQITATDTLTGGEEKVTVTTTTAGAGSTDTAVPVGVIDVIDATRNPHIGRVDCNAWQAFITS
jgi:hypothetical protein